jgi:hypothetical protein
MKKITRLLFLMLAGTAMAQNAPIDFESGGQGASWTWTVFENATNPPVEIVANPDATGANTSSNVAKFTALQAGQPYAGTESMHGADIGSFTLTPSTSVIKIMVWKTVISDVGIKLSDNAGGSLGEIKVANTLINQWEELTFNFASREGIPYDQIVIFPDFNARAADNIIYFDNITFSAQGALPVEPLVAAPTPTRNPANVISMFSNAYTNVPVDTWHTDWSAATLSDVQIAGNDTKKYDALSFVGVETVGANSINASSMLYFHVDIWTANMTTFRIKLVDFGTDNAFGGGNDVEHEVVFNNPAQSEWVSYDIPLTDFTGLVTKEHISQLIFSGNPAGAGTVYIDNVYFSNEPLTDPNTPMVAAPTPTRDPANVISMFSNAYTNVAVDTWKTSWSSATLEDLQIAGNDTKKYANLDFVGIETVGPNAIDASSMLYFHVDAWTPNMTTFRIKLVDFGADNAFGGGNDVEHEIVFTNPAQGEWVGYDIPLSQFTGLTTTSHISQLIFSGLPTGGGTVFIDNVYFSNEALGVRGFTRNTFSAYPNPANDALTIESASLLENIEVYNLLGQRVMNAMPETSVFSFDISELGTGVYIVKATTNGVTTSQRIVKK